MEIIYLKNKSLGMISFLQLMLWTFKLLESPKIFLSPYLSKIKGFCAIFFAKKHKVGTSRRVCIHFGKIASKSNSWIFSILAEVYFRSRIGPKVGFLTIVKVYSGRKPKVLFLVFARMHLLSFTMEGDLKV
jgi:hypothetical protein